MAVAATYSGGLADPVFGSQAIFRHVMDAMANPGRVTELGELVKAPEPLNTATAGFLAALADYDTPVWFDTRATEGASVWLAFHTGAPMTDDPTQASFAVHSPDSAAIDWSRLAIGTASYPDRSATVLLPVLSFEKGTALTLRGPGIETRTTICVEGLPQDFLSAMTANRSRFPLGFDVILTAGSRLLALPRSTSIEDC